MVRIAPTAAILFDHDPLAWKLPVGQLRARCELAMLWNNSKLARGITPRTPHSRWVTTWEAGKQVQEQSGRSRAVRIPQRDRSRT